MKHLKNTKNKILPYIPLIFLFVFYRGSVKQSYAAESGMAKDDGIVAESPASKTTPNYSGKSWRKEKRIKRSQRASSGLAEEAYGSFWQYWPTINSFRETDISPGFDVTCVNHRGFHDDRFSIYFGPLKMEDTSPSLKLNFAQFLFERRYYFRNRMYWHLSTGVNYFDPRDNLKTLYNDIGQSISSFVKPFGSIGIGWQVGRINLPNDMSFPFLLRLRYTFSKEYKFPSLLPNGTEGIDPHGPWLTVGLRYRF